MTERPTGTVTFLFTDLEGSTRLWEEHPDAMQDALKRHDGLLQLAVEAHHGYVVKTTGDGIHAAFATADDAVAAAIAAQLAFDAEVWAATGPLKVRMGLHTGAAELRDGDYYGPALNRAARLMATAHGGQIVLSHATEELIRDGLASNVELEDLGEHRLKDLGRTEHVFQVNAPGLPRLFPALHSLDAQRTNLPSQMTSFVGRDAEVDAVTELLAEHRVVTLTGPGGVGKTRLAVAAAANSVDRFPDGTWLVELASIESLPVVDVIASALDIELPRDRAVEDAVVDALGSRSPLLVIDNCEHVMTEVRRVAETLLREAPGVTILATSREGLRVTGEQLYSVPSLDGEAAVRLFVDRAKAVDPTITLDEAQVEAIARVCDRLDGIPLAIELAAARVTMFGIEDLAGRVEQRFRFLTGGRGRVERHQTLRSAIDWSYDLLTAEERVAFTRLSVFPGGCTLEAAEAVLHDDALAEDRVLDVVSSLIDKSLVVVDRGRPVTRYAMLETIRQYAGEALVATGDVEAVRDRYVEWCVGFARAAGRGLYSPDELVWLERVDGEIDNLQVAVAWAVATDATDAAMRIGGAFARQAMARPLLGTAYLAEQAMAVRGFDEHPARARVLAEAAWALYLRGDRDAARELLERSVAEVRAGARFAVAAFTGLLGIEGAIAAWRREGPGEWRGYEVAKDGLQMAEAAGDVLAITGLRTALACQAMLCGHEHEAFEQAERALAEANELRQPTLEAAARYALAMAISTRDPDAAMVLVGEALVELHAIGNDHEHSAALLLLAGLEARHGDIRRGLDAMRTALVHRLGAYREAGPFVGAALFNRVGRPDLVALTEGFWVGHMLRPPPYYAEYQASAAVEARALLGDAEYDTQAAEGSRMDNATFAEHVLVAIDEAIAGLEAE